jgi:hypothetical protein
VTGTLPLTARIDRFGRRRPDIMIAAPWATPTGKWEVSVPGHTAVAYDRGVDMMDDLEARYAETPRVAE